MSPKTARDGEPNQEQCGHRPKGRFLHMQGLRTRFELIILVVLVVIVWGLLSLPIAFYYQVGPLLGTMR